MENQLKHLEDFKQVLRHYEISPTGKELLQKTALALLVAPSGSGRNTIVHELLKTAQFHYIVSDTTRKPRINDGVLEQNGVEYWFRSEAEMLDDLKAGRYLEAAIIHDQQVSGISLREIRKAHKEHKIALTDIEIAGMSTIIAEKPDVHALFVIPPSFSEWMRRLEARGEMPYDEKRRRLRSAEHEFTDALRHSYYKFVLNDTLAHAAKQIQALTAGEMDADMQNSLYRITEDLLRETRQWLANVIG